MKKIIWIIVTLLSIAIIWYGCSKDKLPTPSKSHPVSWSQKSSVDFHGKKVLEVGYNSCTSCHGSDLMGGESQVACMTCHETYPHPDGWQTTGRSEFHGTFLKTIDWEASRCESCHGEDYSGGSSEVTCYQCHASFPHLDDWSNTGTAGFHGTYVKNASYDLSSCSPCHGTDYKGGTSEVSCLTCHASYPHQPEWNNSASEVFHGKYIMRADWDPTSCQSCHGSDYSGGSSGFSCYTCHASYPHAENWTDTAGSEFHGQYLKNAGWSLTSCKSCHGELFLGGDTEVSCYTCHKTYPHTGGWIVPTATDFHGESIRGQNWSMAICKSCHGDDYRGGSSEVTCYLCHTAEGGPEACNVCHGSIKNAAPPEDLSGNTETTAIGVGQHQLHFGLYDHCEFCHYEPKSFSDPKHIDGTPNAEIKGAWKWNRETKTCNSICHVNPNSSYIWTGSGAIVNTN